MSMRQPTMPETPGICRMSWRVIFSDPSPYQRNVIFMRMVLS
jgi:hypothetical protein